MLKQSAGAQTEIEQREDWAQVILLTEAYRVRGYITMVPGTRLTDYLAEAREFIALTHAEVRNSRDELVLSAPFLNVNRARVHVIVPADSTNKGAWKSHWDAFRNRPGDL